MVKFWDPSKDSLWAVSQGGQYICVYCSSAKAQLAAEDLDGQVVEIKNQELPDFWFYNEGLELIR